MYASVLLCFVRREMFAEDRSLLRDNEAEKVWPWAILDEDKNMLTRPVPDLFTVYKVRFRVLVLFFKIFFCV